MEPINQTNLQPRSHAKDVFLNLAALVALYMSAGALLSILFTVISKAYPSTMGYYAYYSPSISFPVATLIVMFPLYIVFMWLIEKDAVSSVDAHMSNIQKWLVYITLFISGSMIVGDLVAVLYAFIDGQDLTPSFLYKALSVAVVGGMVFAYYITEARNKLTSASRKIALISSVVLVFAVIVLGFSIIGSPRSQQLLKYDTQRITDLENIKYQVEDFYFLKKALPDTLNALAVDSYRVLPHDPQTQKSYMYTKTGDTTYTLCADFNTDSFDSQYTQPSGYYMTWNHPAGSYCFALAIKTD